MNEFLTNAAETLEYVGILLPSLLQGALVTVELFALTLLLSIPLGLPFALGSNSRFFPIRWICKAYIWVFRGTPLMLQLFFFYFFLPITLGITLDSFTTAVVTFVLNYAAYLAEIYRAGIESIDKGQYEAAQSLGIGPHRTMFGIIIPQTVKRVLPPVSNEAITLIKDTALRLRHQCRGTDEGGKRRGKPRRKCNGLRRRKVIYLIFTFLLTLLSRNLEKRFSRHELKGE